ncbi:MAG: sulfatase-like hydrolase/transferase, partial [Planctomycetota bacterium]
MSQRPNIIYLNSHDTGRAIGPMGYRIHTPHLQRLAEEGVLFRDCHCAAPTCSPSRAALITGEAPHCNGMLGLAHRGWGLQDHSRTIPAVLLEQGYRTAAWGMPANHCIGPEHGEPEASSERMGYGDWLGWDLEQLTGFLGSDHDRPFFLSASWGLTHRAAPAGRGFGAEPDHERYDPRYCAPPPLLPDDAETRADWAWFCSAATELDRQMGAVIQAVEEAGLAEQTLIIATTDHGIPFPGNKCELTASGTGVFLIMRGPGGFTGGQSIDHLVSQLDIFPSICQMLDLPAPAWLQGVPLQATLGPEGHPIHDQLQAEVTYHAAYEPKRALRTDRWLYVRRFGCRRQPVLSNRDHGASKDHWVASGWRDQVEADEELYDT